MNSVYYGISIVILVWIAIEQTAVTDSWNCENSVFVAFIPKGDSETGKET